MKSETWEAISAGFSVGGRISFYNVDRFTGS